MQATPNPIIIEPPRVDTDAVSPRAKRKARSTRRRLNAMMSNASLHFSDTDSEGELTKPRIVNVNNKASKPSISITLEPGDDSGVGHSGRSSRRSSFVDNLTDVDEIFSEGENEKPSFTAIYANKLSAGDNVDHGDTDVEDVSNDESEPIHEPIFVKVYSDILKEFTGEMITTKEGDGPFSVEVRKRMSLDEDSAVCKMEKEGSAPDIVVEGITDIEDMEASDDDLDDDLMIGACSLPVYTGDMEPSSDSQIVMTNSAKMDLLMPMRDAEDAISDGLTDIEDLE